MWGSVDVDTKLRELRRLSSESRRVRADEAEGSSDSGAKSWVGVGGAVEKRTKILEILSLGNLRAERTATCNQNFVVRDIHRVAKTILNADKVTLFVVNAAANRLTAVVSEDIEGLQLRIGCGIAGRVAECGRTIHVRDAYHDTNFFPVIDMKTGYRTRSVLCAPILGIGGRVVAVIQAINKIRDSTTIASCFDEDDEFMMQYLVSQAGVALEVTWMSGQVQRYRSTLTSVFDVMQTMAAPHITMDQAVDIILSAANRLVGADRISMSIIDWSAKELIVNSSRDVKGVRFPIGKSFAGHVARTGDVLNIRDAYLDDRFNAEVDQTSGYRTRSILTVPVGNQDSTVVAVLQAINKKGPQGDDALDQRDGGVFNQDDELLLLGVAGLAALRLKNARLSGADQLHRNRLTGIAALASSLSEHLRVNEVATLMVKHTTSMLDGKCLMHLIDAGKGLCAEYTATDEVTDWVLLPDSGLLASVGRHGNTAHLEDAYDVANRGQFDPSLDEFDGFRTQAVLAVPIISSREEIIGVLRVARSTKDNAFSSNDLSLLKLLVAHGGVALENARLFEKEKVQAAYVEELLQLISPYTIALDLEGRISMCTEKLKSLIDDKLLGETYHKWLFPEVHDRLVDDISSVYETLEEVSVVDYPLTVPFREEEGADTVKVNYKIRPVSTAAGLSPTSTRAVGIVLFFEFPGEREAADSKLKRAERKVKFLRQEVESAKRELFNSVTAKVAMDKSSESVKLLLEVVRTGRVVGERLQVGAAKDGAGSAQQTSDPEQSHSDSDSDSDSEILDYVLKELHALSCCLQGKDGPSHQDSGGAIQKTTSLDLSSQSIHARPGQRRHSVSAAPRSVSCIARTGSTATSSAVHAEAKHPGDVSMSAVEDRSSSALLKDFLSSAFGSGARAAAAKVMSGSSSESGSAQSSKLTSGAATPRAIQRRVVELSTSRMCHTLKAEVLEQFHSWSFDVLEIGEVNLNEVVLEIFEETDIVDSCGVDMTHLQNFVSALSAQYRSSNAFHNFYHAVATMHYTFLFIVTTSAGGCLNKRLQWYGALVAALGHDVDHPGLSNTFQINTQSPLAMRYNDHSVLEMHHCATTFKTMARPDCDITGHFSVDEKKLFRKVVVNAILQTDMVRHYQLVNDMKDASVEGKFDADQHPGGDSVMGFEDAVLLVSAIVHASDLGNPVRPFDVARKWAIRLSEEFKLQGEKEVAAGLPMSPLAKSAGSELSLAKGELYFCGMVVLPFWEVMSDILPGITTRIDQAKQNLNTWKRKASELQDAAAAAAAAAPAAAGAPVTAPTAVDASIGTDGSAKAS